MEERIVELSGAGVPANIIASTVGCDPSYVSQILGREDVQEKVAQLRMAKAAGMIKHDESIEHGEKLALGRLIQMIPLTTDAMKLTRIFQTLNSAKKSSDQGVAGAAAQPATIVTLNLPAAAQVHFKLTSDRQVIEVEGRSMVPMQSMNVAKRLRELQATRLLDNSVATDAVPAISNRTKSIVDSL